MSFGARPGRSRGWSLARGRREDSQAMAVGVERHERMAEVQLDRGLGNGKAAHDPIAMLRAYGVRIVDRESQFAPAKLSGGCRFDRVFGPESEHHARAERKEREGGTGFNGCASE